MNFQQTKNAFVKLGQSFQSWSLSDDSVIEKAYLYNNWFTSQNVKMALNAWSNQLTPSNIDQWISKYDIGKETGKSVAIIMAGNIPLVGLHDLISVLITGHHALVKLSSDDTPLMKAAIDELIRIEPQFENRIKVLEMRLPKTFDAVIATGSNNSNRYFEYYFKDKPNLLRKNRSSVAVLYGEETTTDLENLGADIFTYFGLGCRNVAKLYVPEGFNFTTFFESIASYSYVIDHNKYANNYGYHKSIFLMNLAKHLDNGFLIVKEDESLSSPLSTLFYEYFSDINQLTANLGNRKDEIQCIVGKNNNMVPFGKSQEPQLWDYADGVDTVAFLLSI